MQKESYLVVVSILEGKNFPSRQKHQLVIECKFDGELLSTDPIPHSDVPNFTTELAWEMDKKSLHQHRMQRTPVKLQCYAMDTVSKVREHIGYILLDLRLAQIKAHPAKWYQLLSSKYSRLKPAIKIAMILEDDSGHNQPGFKAQEAPPRPVKKQNKHPGKLEAVLIEDEGHFQIGPNSNDCEIFVVSVTLGSAFNLEQLINAENVLPSVLPGYFFYYSLFGSDITNDVFKDLLSPNITPERASIRVRSTVDTLKSYFVENPSLSIHLCCADQLLGSTIVTFSKFFSKKHMDMLDREAVTIEGAYTLSPANKTSEITATQPRVNASVSLRKESVPLNSSPLKSKSPEKKILDASPDEEPVRDTDQEVTTSSDDPKPLPTPNLPEDKVEMLPKSPEKQIDTDDDALSINSDTENIPTSTPDPSKAMNDKSSSLTTTETHTDIPQPLQHFRFSLELKTLSKLQLPHPCNLFLKYSYPFFGSFSPIMTSPIAAFNHHEVVIPRSMCIFDFACPSNVLVSTFRSFPINIECWHRGSESSDELLGTSTLHLSQIINSQRDKIALEQNGKMVTGYRQTGRDSIPVTSNGREVATLNLLMLLEDFGVAVDQEVIRKKPKPQESEKKVVEKAKNPRETTEYKTAMELELWKSQEQDKFARRMKQLEEEQLRRIGDEFASRDAEREALISKRISEYQVLEKQLKASISDMEKREAKIKAGEVQLERMIGDCQREKERNIAEAKEATKRMKDDCIHQVQLERERRGFLEEQNRKLTKQISDLEQKYSGLMTQFYELKSEQSKSPEVRLQAELNMIGLEKRELERKLESSTKSKLHYKQQWGRALKELAMMKTREQESAFANLKQQQTELENLKLRYLASDEKKAISADQNQLQQIAKDLEILKQDRKEPVSIVIASDHDKPRNSEQINERVSRLIEERDTLLRTGVYSQSDRIISELDRQIKEEMSKKQNC